MSNDDRWNDESMNNDDQYQDSDSYEQADYGASEGDHYDAAMDEEVQQNRRGGGG